MFASAPTQPGPRRPKVPPRSRSKYVSWYCLPYESVELLLTLTPADRSPSPRNLTPPRERQRCLMPTPRGSQSRRPRPFHHRTGRVALRAASTSPRRATRPSRPPCTRRSLLTRLPWRSERGKSRRGESRQGDGRRRRLPRCLRARARGRPRESGILRVQTVRGVDRLGYEIWTGTEEKGRRRMQRTRTRFPIHSRTAGGVLWTLRWQAPAPTRSQTVYMQRTSASVCVGLTERFLLPTRNGLEFELRSIVSSFAESYSRPRCPSTSCSSDVFGPFSGRRSLRWDQRKSTGIAPQGSECAVAGCTAPGVALCSSNSLTSAMNI